MTYNTSVLSFPLVAADETPFSIKVSKDLPHESPIRLYVLSFVRFDQLGQIFGKYEQWETFKNLRESGDLVHCFYMTNNGKAVPYKTKVLELCMNKLQLNSDLTKNKKAVGTFCGFFNDCIYENQNYFSKFYN